VDKPGEDMTRKTLAALCLSASTFGCADLSDEMSAMDELLVSSLSGAEDSMSAETGSRMADDGRTLDETSGEPDRSVDGPDRSKAPPMFRMCDAEGTFVGLVDAYDSDESGLVDGPEVGDVEREHAGPKKGPRRHFLHMLRVVYDTDRSGEFEDGELDLIFTDFTERCEAIHAEVLTQYDVDGDGELSESERDAARAGHMAQMEDEREKMDACREGMERPERPEGAEGGRPPKGAGGGEEGPGGQPPFGPLEQEFDVDGDGALSEAELDSLRTEMRARIASGERPHPECDAAE
jgi:hypothetical protein